MLRDLGEASGSALLEQQRQEVDLKEDVAELVEVSRVALSSLLNGRANLSGDMALRVEKAFGVRMETLMRMQSSYDIVQTRQRARSITVRRYRRRVA